jgi:hypothetical protein
MRSRFYKRGRKTQTLGEWCRELDLPYLRIYMRIERGDTFEQAISRPFNKKPRRIIGKRDVAITIAGVTKNMSAWCREYGLEQSRVWKRISRGWEPIKAVTTKERSRRPDLFFGSRDHTKAYLAWRNAKSRCINPKNSRFANYGGRGITFDKRWDDFAAFLGDMGDPPTSRHTLERKMVNGPYNKANCIWATMAVQSRNRRNNRNVILDGKSHIFHDLCAAKGVNPRTADRRLRSGKSVEEVFGKTTVTKHDRLEQERRTKAVWRSMRHRCDSQKNPAYKNYGGRGIGYVAEWSDFGTFLKEMGLQPVGKTLDRRDNEKGYSRNNCCWATRGEQNRNMRSNRRITVGGRTQILSDWCKEYAIDGSTVSRRLRSGWSAEKALSTPCGNFVHHRPTN